MKIDVYATQNSVIEKEWKDRLVVIIDVLRATSTIITALDNGCKEVIPVTEIEEAVNISRSIDPEGFLLGGERNAVKIDGFHLSNSPLEYTREVVEGRTVVITTTNGTKAIKKAGDAREVLIGGFLNASAVGDHVACKDMDVTIICAGTGGKFSLDDIITAGAIIDGIMQKAVSPVELDDLALVCKFLYDSHKDHVLDALKDTYHYRVLEKAGFYEDIRFCFQKDRMATVPVYKDGVIKHLVE